MQFREDADLSAQHFWNNGHRNIIHRAATVALNFIGVCEMNAGDENNGSFVKPGMLADDIRELKSIDVRHADIHENNGNIVLQKDVQSLRGRSGLNEIGVQSLKNHLVTEELGRLVVHHEDV